jgi:predicted MPP superfamily phosphohydrolase
MGSLHIIHLSDLHIDEVSFSEIMAMTDSLCKKLHEFIEKKGINSFDLLIISGDLVNRGSDSYDFVRKVVDKISLETRIEQNRIFFVPGNHDVDRNKCNTFAYEKAIETLIEDPGNFIRIQNENSIRESFNSPFERYSSFAKSFQLLKEHCHSPQLPGFAQAKVEIDGLTVRLCGLNSALVAGPNDIKPDEDLKNRCCGFSYLSDMLSGSEKHLNIVVSHYPVAWIHELERTKVQQLLQQKKAIFLSGHIHEHTAETSGLTDTQLLQLGAGSSYGEKWGGKNHCRILELDSERNDVLLHELIWYGAFGWRAFEPLSAQCAGWVDCRHMLLRPSGINHRAASQKLWEVGFVDIRKGRTDGERLSHYDRIIHDAEPSSILIIVGRSLIDWASRWKSIEDAINEKGLHVKLGLIDENSLPDKTRQSEGETNKSWIEQPIPDDWAIDDVIRSMRRFRLITLTGNCTGSLEIYGLPFYVSHSFVAYTNQYDKQRYCAEEAGMALEKEMRPFLEVRSEVYVSIHGAI